MAISTNGTVLARLAGGLYNQTLSNATYAEVNAVVKTAADINALANDLYARDFASKTDLAVATTLVSNLGLSSTVGLNNWVAAQLTAAGAANKGAKIVSLLNDFANLTSDATYGAAATAFNNKAAAALALSQKAGSAGGTFDAASAIAAAEAAAAAAKAAADTAAAEAAAAAAKAAADKVAADAAAAENAAQTFTLTTGTNSLTGKAGNDTFDGSLTSASAQTLNTLDRLDGGAGTDELNATLATSVTPASIVNIETINVGSTGAATLGLSNATGVNAVNIGGAAGTFTLSGVSKSVAVAVSDTDQVHTVSYKDVTGTADAAAVTLANMTGGADLSVAGVEALTIHSSGTDNNIDVVATSATSMVIDGSGDLTVGSLQTATTVKLASIDASQMTGSLSVVTGAQSIGATTLSVMGGAGNDNIDISGNDGVVSVSGGAGNDTVTITLATTDTVSGGEGTDSLIVDAVITSAGNVSGFETFTLNATTLTQDMSKLAGNDWATLVASDAAASFTKVGASVTALKLDSGATSTVGLSRATTTGDSSLTVSSTGSTAVSGTVLTAGNEDSITVTASAAALTMTELAAADLESLTVTGDEAVSIVTISGTTTLATVDASAATGAVTLGTTNSSQVAMTITAGSGGLTADGAALNDTMIGGAGVDSFDGNSGNDSLTGGAGNDDLDGGAGNDYLNGGDGNDQITSGSGDDIIVGGAGNDTITLAGDYTTADAVDGGDGTDTVELTGVNATTTPTLTSIEKLTLTTSGAGTNTYALTNASAVTSITIADSADNVATTISSFAGGAVTISEDDDVAYTIDTLAGASLSVTANAVNTVNGDLVVTDAVSVTVGTSLADASFDDVTVDSVDTTSMTFSATSTYDIIVDDVLGTDAVTSLTLSAVTTESAVDLDVDLNTVATAGALTTLTLTANGGEVDIGAIGGTVNANVLATITATATVGGDITVGNISADLTDSVTDNQMTVTASADGASTVDLSNINNQYGSVTLNFSGEGTVSLSDGNLASSGAESVTAVDVVITRTGAGATVVEDVTASGNLTATLTGSGAFTLGDASDGLVTVTGTTNVDGSAQTGAMSVEMDGTNSITVLGGSAADLIALSGTTASGKTHSVDGGAGNDSITGGAGSDIIVGGAGNDLITSGGGNDNLQGGAGNDTFVLSTGLTSADTVSGGDGTDTLQFTTAALSTALSSSDIEVIEVTSGGAHTVDLSAVTGLTRITNIDTGDHAFDLTGVASGAIVRNQDNGDTLTIDTVADAAITFEANVTNTNDITFTDAASVTIKQTLTTAGSDVVIESVVLDATDTTSLAFVGSSVATNDLSMDVAGSEVFTGTDALETFSATTSTSGALTLSSMADIDSLTTLTATAAIGNITIGQLGTDATANNGENLATITASATGGATVDFADIYSDSTVNSTVDLAQTITASAATSSTVDFDKLDNTYGDITAAFSGQGTVDTGSVIARDITITRTDGGASTFGALTASGDLSLTASGSGTAVITTMAVTGDYTVDASAKTGTLNIAANTSAGSGVVKGGSGDDTLRGADGDDSIVGGDGIDSIYGGTGSDTLEGGAGNDTFVMSTDLATGDSIVGGEGTDTLTATLTASKTAVISGVETLTLTLDGGSFNAASTTGATKVNVLGSGSAVLTNLSSTVTSIFQKEDLGAVSYGYATGAAATVTLDFDSATEDASNSSTSISNVASLTIDGAADYDLALGSLTASALTALTISAEGDTGDGDVDTGNITANALQTISATATAIGDITIGDIARATALTSITLTGSGTATGDFVVGNIGTNTSTQATLALKTITITTYEDGGSEVDVGNIVGDDGDTTYTDDAELTSITIDLAGDYDDSSVGTVYAESLGTLSITTGVDDAGADEALVIAGFEIDRNVGSISITSGGGVDIAAGFISSTTTGTIGDVTLVSTGGVLDIDAGNIAFDAYESIGNITVTTDGGTVDLGKIDEATTVGNITIDANDNVSLDGAEDATSVGDISIEVASGDTVDMNDVAWGATGGVIGTYTAGGAGSVTFATGALLSIGDIDLSSLDGSSTITLSNSTLVGVTFTGGDGVDTFVATGGSDDIAAGDGADVITGNGGSDTIDLGVEGDADVVVFLASTDGGTTYDSITGFVTTEDKIDIIAKGTSDDTSAAWTADAVGISGITAGYAVVSGAGSADTVGAVKYNGAGYTNGTPSELVSGDVLIIAGTAASTSSIDLTDAEMLVNADVLAFLQDTLAEDGTDANNVVIIQGTASSAIWYVAHTGATYATAELTLIGVVDAVLVAGDIQ